jgi:hypothetical protein
VATIFDNFVDGTGSKNGPVPAVDPADLKSIWALQTDSQTLARQVKLCLWGRALLTQ